MANIAEVKQLAACYEKMCAAQDFVYAGSRALGELRKTEPDTFFTKIDRSANSSPASEALKTAREAGTFAPELWGPYQDALRALDERNKKAPLEDQLASQLLKDLSDMDQEHERDLSSADVSVPMELPQKPDVKEEGLKDAIAATGGYGALVKNLLVALVIALFLHVVVLIVVFLVTAILGLRALYDFLEPLILPLTFVFVALVRLADVFEHLTASNEKRHQLIAAYKEEMARYNALKASAEDERRKRVSSYEERRQRLIDDAQSQIAAARADAERATAASREKMRTAMGNAAWTEGIKYFDLASFERADCEGQASLFLSTGRSAYELELSRLQEVVEKERATCSELREHILGSGVVGESTMEFLPDMLEAMKSGFATDSTLALQYVVASKRQDEHNARMEVHARAEADAAARAADAAEEQAAAALKAAEEQRRAADAAERSALDAARTRELQEEQSARIDEMRNSLYDQVDQLNQQIGDMYDWNDGLYDDLQGLTEENAQLRDTLDGLHRKTDSLNSDMEEVGGAVGDLMFLEYLKHPEIFGGRRP